MLKEKEGHDGHTIFLRFYLSDRDDLAREGLVLRTRAKLWPEARQNTAQRTIGGGHVEVRTAMDRRSTTGHSGPIRDEGSI